MTDEKARHDEFVAWLTRERIGYGMMPTPERMLQSPDSLTRAQRAWLREFVKRGQ